MSVMLENISTITVVARTTVSAVFRAAQIVASMPNLSYQNKARTRYQAPAGSVPSHEFCDH